MKQRCCRQHRIGEVCGAKLVDMDNVTRVDEDCKICQEIIVKQRRLQKERDNIARWSREGERFAASLEKARREEKLIMQQIEELRLRRPSVIVKLNWEARGTIATPSPGIPGYHGV